MIELTIKQERRYMTGGTYQDEVTFEVEDFKKVYDITSAIHGERSVSVTITIPLPEEPEADATSKED